MRKNLENLPKNELFALKGLSAIEVFAYLESKGFEPYWNKEEEYPCPEVEDDFCNVWLFGCNEDGSFVCIERMNYDDYENKIKMR